MPAVPYGCTHPRHHSTQPAREKITPAIDTGCISHRLHFSLVSTNHAIHANHRPPPRALSRARTYVHPHRTCNLFTCTRDIGQAEPTSTGRQPKERKTVSQASFHASPSRPLAQLSTHAGHTLRRWGCMTKRRESFGGCLTKGVALPRFSLVRMKTTSTLVGEGTAVCCAGMCGT